MHSIEKGSMDFNLPIHPSILFLKNIRPVQENDVCPATSSSSHYVVPPTSWWQSLVGIIHTSGVSRIMVPTLDYFFFANQTTTSDHFNAGMIFLPVVTKRWLLDFGKWNAFGWLLLVGDTDHTHTLAETDRFVTGTFESRAECCYISLYPSHQETLV